MIVAVLAVFAATLAGGWLLLLALLGRSAHPARERLSLRSWGPADLRANAARGAACVCELEQARRPSRG